jgi:cobalamin biosynthesis protein CbiD|tara:strand:- start:563 stop:1003 length:441 start_codon:yes stop_codon:yes gene_type:complete
MGLKISAVLGLLLIASLGAFKLYYDKSEAEKEAMAVALQQAMNNQLLLENTIKDQNQQMEEQLAREQKSQARITQLSTANSEAMEEVTELRGKFARHDLNMLSMTKPGLLEKMVNRGTVRVFEELETLTQPDQFDEDTDDDSPDPS